MQVRSEQRPSMGSETKGPVTNHVASALASSAHIPHGLDWEAFSAGYFPGRQRHDLEALTAYGAYRLLHAVDERAAGHAARMEAESGPIAGPRFRTWKTRAARGYEVEERSRFRYSRRIRARTIRSIPGARSPLLAGAH